MKKIILLPTILLSCCQCEYEFAPDRVGESYIFRNDTLLVIEWRSLTTYRVLNTTQNNDTQIYSILLFDKLKKIK